jgi:hypothetical protein
MTVIRPQLFLRPLLRSLSSFAFLLGCFPLLLPSPLSPRLLREVAADRVLQLAKVDERKNERGNKYT